MNKRVARVAVGFIAFSLLFAKARAIVNVASSEDPVEAKTREVLNLIWDFQSAFLIFFMQAGFGMLESGSVTGKWVKEILLKVHRSILGLEFRNWGTKKNALLFDFTPNPLYISRNENVPSLRDSNSPFIILTHLYPRPSEINRCGGICAVMVCGRIRAELRQSTRGRECLHRHLQFLSVE